MDSFVIKSISRNHHLRICFMWSLWKFPVKLDRTRLTSVISANCLTAPPDSSASHASLLKQIPLGCEHIEEKRWSLQQRIRLVRCWRAYYLFADVFPPGSVHCGAVKRISWKENNYNPKEKYTLVHSSINYAISPGFRTEFISYTALSEWGGKPLKVKEGEDYWQLIWASSLTSHMQRA